MAKAPAFQFYPNDWLGDANLQAAKANTRGAWMNLLAHMWGSKEQGKLSGTVDQIRRLANVEEREIEEILSEIKSLKIGTVTERNEKVTVMNRRMYRRFKDREQGRLRQRKHRVSRHGNGKGDDDVTLHPSDSPPDSPPDTLNQSPPTPSLILTAFIEKFHKHPDSEEIWKLINGNEDFIGFETAGRLLFAINSIKKPDKIENPIGWLIEFSKKPHDYLTVKQHDDYKRTR